MKHRTVHTTYTCDRCGFCLETTDLRIQGWGTVVIRSSDVTEYRDLCPGCFTELAALMGDRE